MSAFSSTNDPCGAASPAAFDCMNDFEQQTLFSGLETGASMPPLAERMRPRTLDEFVGQERLLGPGRLLRRAIEADRLQSSIFWGPPGCGKTTLASIIARMTGSAFEKLNAVTSGVADVRQVLKEAQDRRLRYGRATYLLLDECHRWSKAQSDSILPAIESGLIRFIGSTTENPMVSMTPAIVSRCRVFQFEPLQTQDVLRVLQNALRDPERGYGGSDVRAEDGALAYIARMSGGDVRTALGALELAWLTTAEETDPSTGRPFKRLTLETAQESVQKPLLKMDEGQYYDMLSAFIKSMRGSDPDAALFWFSRLLYAGVDPRLIVRRIVVHASEDVGLADPLAMLQAQAAVTALEFVGMPEARIPIAQAIIAVCLAEKSNSAGWLPCPRTCATRAMPRRTPGRRSTNTPTIIPAISSGRPICRRVMSIPCITGPPARGMKPSSATGMHADLEKVMKHELKRKPDVQKTTMLALVVNAVQIGVLFAFVLYVLTAGPEARNSWSLQFMVIAGALMAAWGAGVDIQDALRTRRLERTIGELQTTNEQMDALNLKLRAQRHDFLNHLQVVYSLLEMQEYGEATAYLERVYDEHRSVSSVLRTKMTAFNALLQVKSAACEERGIALEMDIRSTLEGLPVPPWELCCIIGNLMDNAMDAVEDVPGGRIRLSVSEELRGFTVVICKNGAPIPEELLGRLFEPGVSTKGEGHGLGLSIVRSTLAEFGGTISLETGPETVFTVTVPRESAGASKPAPEGR